MRYHLAEAIRINGLPAQRRHAEVQRLPLGTRTIVAALAKHLQRRTHETPSDARGMLK